MSLSNLLEFSVKMKDMMSGGLAKLASTAQSTFKSVQGNIDNVGKTTESVFKNVTKNISNSFDGISNRIRDTREQLKELQRTRDASTRQTSGGGGFLGGMLSQALPVVGIAGALALGGQLFNGAAQREKDVAGLTTFLGAKQANVAYSNIQKDAAATPFETDSLLMSNRALISAGISADKARKDTMNLANAISAVGGGDVELSRMATNMQQIGTTGKASAMDIKQFAFAGINIYEMLHRSTGKSIAEVKEMDITYAQLSTALQKASEAGGMYAGALEAQAQTMGGRLSTLWDNLKIGLADLGTELAPLFNAFLDFGNTITSVIIPGIVGMVKWLKQNADWLGLLAVVVGTAGLAYGAYFVWVNAMSWAMMAQTTIVGGLTAAWTWLSAAMMANPIGFIIAAIAALVAGLVYAYYHFEKFRSVVDGLWEAFKQVFTNIGTFFKQTFEPIFKAIDYFKKGEYASAALEVGKMVYNLSPVGMAVNATKFALDGGFTKDVGKKYTEGVTASLLKNKQKKTSLSEVADASKTNTSTTTTSNEEVAKDITSGGARVININGVKFAEKIEFHVANMAEGAEQALTTFEDMFLRVLNSGAIVQ